MNHNNPQAPVLLPAFVVLIVLIGLLLRIVTLGIDVRFHPDEALFAAQARLISHEGDWLLRTTDLDKPPLTFYITALSFRAFGPGEFAARLPNVLFSALSTAVVVALARSLYGDRTLAALVGLLLALSPYDLAFSATVFTDVQATFWTLVAALCAVRDRWRWAGIAAALMFAAKPNALLFLPLILPLGIAHNAKPEWRRRDGVQRLWRFAWSFALGIGIVVLWDIARAPRSFLELGAQRNNPGRLVRSDEVWPRLKQWAHWFHFITGSRVVNGLAVAGGGIVLAAGVRRRSRAVVTDWLIVGSMIAWLAWHWLIAFNTYDRYIHTLVPFAVLLIARVMTAAARKIIPHVIPMTALICVLILPHTLAAVRGELPLGGDQGQHTGIDMLAAYLNTELRGEIVYDHWLGWELAYYLGPDSQIRLIYQPLPEALADEMRTQAKMHDAEIPYTATRYFLAPSPEAAAPWLDALRRAGIRILIVYNAQFMIYALAP